MKRKVKNNQKNMQVSRRRFLKNISASALSAASITGVVNPLNAFQAQAQTLPQVSNDYRALVCVFFLGGMDNHDTVLPFDPPSYDEFARIRQPLLSQHGDTRLRENLLPINPLNSSGFGNRRFALPLEFTNLKNLFDSGDAAIVGNVGPLVEPTNREQFLLRNTVLPPRLFSHNDQQAVWQSSQPEGALFGWGGRFADAALVNNPANNSSNNPTNGSTFNAITSGGNELFLTGETSNPFQISANGTANIDLLEQVANLGLSDQFTQRLLGHFQAQGFNSSNLIETDVSGIIQNAFTANGSFNRAIQTAPALAQAFPNTPLGNQLNLIAQTISVRETLSVNRQVFFVPIGGFDTHSNQANDLPALQQQIDQGIFAFYQTMQELGLSESVTLFTASDFGRTLAINGDGTDHGWGGNHFVVGGAVNGNQVYGSLPPAAFEHDWDAGGGRLIPTVSVEQYAAPMGRWFGLSDEQLNSTLPNLSNFNAPLLNFV